MSDIFTTLSASCPLCDGPVGIISDQGDGKEYRIDQRPLPPILALSLHGIFIQCKGCGVVLKYQADFLGGLYLINLDDGVDSDKH